MPLDEAALLAALPEDARRELLAARDAMMRAAGGDKTGYNEAFVATARAVAAVGLPPPVRPFQLASSYSGAEYALMALSAMYDLAIMNAACPQYPMTRRRWIGLEPGLLESELASVTHEGVVTQEPLWRAFQFDRTPEAVGARFDAMPVDLALRVLTEAAGTGRGYGIDAQRAHGLVSKLGPDTRDWAIARAEAAQDDRLQIATAIKKYIFFGLLRGGVPIEERWESLIPFGPDVTTDELVEIARAFPEQRRAIALATVLPLRNDAPEIIAAVPSKALVEVLLAGFDAHSVRWTWLAKRLRELGGDELRAWVDEVVAATPAPVSLFVAEIVRPTSADDLDDIAREQLRIAGRGYDGNDLPATARLADDGEETSFRGFVERRRVVDAAGTPAYDLWMFVSDAGAIFKAGTTDELGGLSQGGVVLRTENQSLRVALQAMTAKKPPMATRPKKTAAKKATAKKTKAKSAAKKKKAPP